MLTALPEEVCSDDGDRGHDGRSSSAEDSLCARHVTGTISLMCAMILWSVDSCPPLHFSHGGTEAEKGEVTCPCPWVGGDRSWTWTLRGAWLQAETAVSRPERLAFLILHAEHNLSAERAEKFAGGLLPVLALHVLRLGAPLQTLANRDGGSPSWSPHRGESGMDLLDGPWRPTCHGRFW